QLLVAAVPEAGRGRRRGSLPLRRPDRRRAGFAILFVDEPPATAGPRPRTPDRTDPLELLPTAGLPLRLGAHTPSAAVAALPHRPQLAPGRPAAGGLRPAGQAAAAEPLPVRRRREPVRHRRAAPARGRDEPG